MNKELSPKQKAIYQAVMELFEEGADLNNLTVAEITGKAGIGKGTAYEYFSDKEEMITRALFYNTDQFIRQIYEGVRRKKNLYDKIDYVLLMMEQQMTKASCILRLIHIMSDNSIMSQRIREMERKRTGGEMLPLDMVEQILKDELKDSQFLPEEKMAYLKVCFFSKILCYGMMIKNSKYSDEDKRGKLRNMICCGVCREIEEILT